MDSSLGLSEELFNQLQDGKSLKDQGYRGRFAPSPTGSLHLGNIRTALLSWLKARLSNGVWLLRIDDLDEPRNRSGSLESIQENLIWLGLTWDGPVIKQKDRISLYLNALQSFRNKDLLYACRCSRRDIQANQIKAFSEMVIYPGFCRNKGYEFGSFDGRLPSWRLKVQKKNFYSQGDLVVRRSDGFIAYNLATVVDELTLGISEVVRGEDLSSARNSQIAISDALNCEPVSYSHVPLWMDKNGQKLSKRNGSFGLNFLREKGLTSPQVIGYLASSLNIVPKEVEISAKELLGEFQRRGDLQEKLFNKEK